MSNRKNGYKVVWNLKGFKSETKFFQFMSDAQLFHRAISDLSKCKKSNLFFFSDKSKKWETLESYYNADL